MDSGSPNHQRIADTRTCWICHGTDGSEWLTPCQGKGSLEHVHGTCYWEWLQHRHIQLQDPRILLGPQRYHLRCDICRTPILVQTYILEPSSSWIFLIITLTLVGIIKLSAWSAKLQDPAIQARLRSSIIGDSVNTIILWIEYVLILVVLCCVSLGIVYFQIRPTPRMSTRLGYTVTRQ